MMPWVIVRYYQSPSEAAINFRVVGHFESENAALAWTIIDQNRRAEQEQHAQ